jgi:hypothetical protein
MTMQATAHADVTGYEPVTDEDMQIVLRQMREDSIEYVTELWDWIETNGSTAAKVTFTFAVLDALEHDFPRVLSTLILSAAKNDFSVCCMNRGCTCSGCRYPADEREDRRTPFRHFREEMDNKVRYWTAQ